MKKLLLLTGIIMGFVSGVADASEPALALTHTVVSQQQTATGTDITLDVVIHNPSAKPLINVSIEVTDPAAMTQAGNHALSVGSLAANGDVTVTWRISTTNSGFDVSMPLAVHVTGTDSTGAAVDFSAVSVAR